jgi:hypothetical protein
MSTQYPDRHPESFGGCIRFYPFVTDENGNVTGGPTWHIDANDHHTVGPDTSIQPWIDPASGYLHFYMLEKNPIISGYLSADETLGPKGIAFCGPSNGTKLVRFRCLKDNRAFDLRVEANYQYIQGANNNAWATVVQNVPNPVPAAATACTCNTPTEG